jgi:hypothetical protein
MGAFRTVCGRVLVVKTGFFGVNEGSVLESLFNCGLAKPGGVFRAYHAVAVDYERDIAAWVMVLVSMA